MINYSIIIPHKNCPDLLQRCVDSIPERDDVQVIVVDDNSNEGKKPSLMERKNLQIILLDASQSKGAGRARNLGLKHAVGKWLLFADADDYYTYYLPTLLDKYADDERTDIVYLNACVFDENNNEKPHKTTELIFNYLNGVEGAEMHLRYNLWTPWSRMVKRDISSSHNLHFDELPAGNDKMFCLYCSRFSQRIAAEKDVVYRYFKPSEGSQTDKNRKNMLESLLDLRSRTITLYREVGYKPVPSLFKLIQESRHNSGFAKTQLFKLYRESLKKANVSIFTDLYNFLYSRN